MLVIPNCWVVQPLVDVVHYQWLVNIYLDILGLSFSLAFWIMDPSQVAGDLMGPSNILIHGWLWILLLLDACLELIKNFLFVLESVVENWTLVFFVSVTFNYVRVVNRLIYLVCIQPWRTRTTYSWGLEGSVATKALSTSLSLWLDDWLLSWKISSEKFGLIAICNVQCVS